MGRVLDPMTQRLKVKENKENDKIGIKPDKNGKRGEAEKSQKQNYNPKGERFLIASRFPTPPLACAFFSPGATVTDFCCSKGNVEDKILVPKLSKNCARCAKCGHPVNGPYCQGCTLLRKKLEEDLVTYFQNFQNTSESSNDSTNVVNAPREPFVVKQDYGVNPPHIDECCCECGDALDGIFCQNCTCKSCGKGAHTGYNCPPEVPIISNPEPCNQTMNNELPQTLPSFDTTCYSDKENSETDNSLSMGDEHLDTVSATKSDKVIKSSVEDLVLIPSDFEGISDTMCDVHLVNNPTPLEAKDHFEIALNSNDDISSSDDDSIYKENVEYVEASPYDSEVISSGSTTTHSDIFLPDYEAFFFNNDHIEEISSGSTTTHSDISLSEYDSFVFDSSNDQFPPTDRSDLTHEEFADELDHIISPPEYDCFYFWNLPDP
nr:hypothetical protein [Tanacetum cinerariifolium]